MKKVKEKCPQYFKLTKSDEISIAKRLETIRVAGEVTSPLNFRFDESYNFKDYIERSGGFLISAKRGRSYIQYPNGERRGVKRFLFFKKYPKVQAGSTIFVSRKPDKTGNALGELIGVTSSLATLAVLIFQIVR